MELAAALKSLVELSGENEVLLANSVHDMIAQGAEVLRCGHAFLDIDLGPNRPTGVDAYMWLKAERFSGRIYFMTGHGSRHPTVAKARAFGQVEVLSKPVPPKLILQIINGGDE